MLRKFTTFTTALAMLLTSGLSAPAMADNKNLRNFLLGAGTVLIIGGVLHDKNTRKRTRKVHVPHHQPQAHRPQQSRKVLPRQCRRNIENRRGVLKRVVMANCLKRNYRHAASLPLSCHNMMRTHNGKRSVYNMKCLRNAGYRVAGH